MAAGQGRRSILTGPGAVSSHAAKGQQPPPSARNTQASLSWRRHSVPELPVSVGFLVEGGVSTVAALASATALAAAAYTGTLPAPARQFAHSVIGAPLPKPGHRPGGLGAVFMPKRAFAALATCGEVRRVRGIR